MFKFIKEFFARKTFYAFESIDFTLKDDLKIEINYEHRLISKKDISYVKFDKNKNSYTVMDKNSSGYYQGFFIDDKGKRVIEFNKLKKLLK